MSDNVMKTLSEPRDGFAAKVGAGREGAALLLASPDSELAGALGQAGFKVSFWLPDSGQTLVDIANAGETFDIVVSVASTNGDVFFDLGGRAFARLIDRMLTENGRLALYGPGVTENQALRLANRFRPVEAPANLTLISPNLYWLAPLARWQVHERLEATDFRLTRTREHALRLLKRIQSAEIRARRAEVRLNEVDQRSRGLAADVIALNQAVLALASSQDSVGRNVMVRLGGLVRKLRNRFRPTAVNPPADGTLARAALFAGAPAPEKDGAPVVISPLHGPILPVDRARVRAFARSQISANKMRELEEWLDRVGEGRPDYAHSALYGYAAAAASSMRKVEIQHELLSKAVKIHAAPSHMVELARFLARRGRIGEARAVVDQLRTRDDAQGREDVLKIAQLIDKKFLWENAEGELERLGKPGESAFEPDSGKSIYFLHNALPYVSAGYATRSHGICLGLIKAGIQVMPATRPGFPHDLDVGPSVPEVIPPSCEIDGVTYVYNTVFGRPEHTEPEYIHKAADEFEKFIRQIRPAVVHAASNYMTGFPALIAARRCGVPFIYEARGFWEITRASREPAFRRSQQFRGMARLEAVCAREADAAITLTTAMKDELIARGVEEAQITLVHNSVDAARFLPQARDEALAERLGIPAGVPVIGYIGSHVIYEGLDDLIAACARLRAKGIDFRLLLVGDGKETPDLIYRAEKAGLGEAFIAPGRVPHEEVESYYSLVDIAPFPRKPWEVCEVVSPLKPFEAMAMEKAVLVSNVRALAEIVEHEERGLQFAKGSVQSLADALERLILDPALRARLGSEARRWVLENRTWDVAGARVADVYRKVLAARRQ